MQSLLYGPLVPTAATTAGEPPPLPLEPIAATTAAIVTPHPPSVPSCVERLGIVGTSALEGQTAAAAEEEAEAPPGKAGGATVPVPEAAAGTAKLQPLLLQLPLLPLQLTDRWLLS